MFIRIIAFIELSIGLSTLSGLIVYSSLSMSQKPLNVSIFVCVASLISILIGLGLLANKDIARKVLIFFSSYIVLTKIMIFLNLMRFNGEIIGFIPASLKNSISILYHGLIIIILNQRDVKESFLRKRR